MSIASCGLGRDGLQRELFSPRETEAILGISHATCYRLITAGKLDARKLGNKTVITAQSIERLVTELPRAGRQVEDTDSGLVQRDVQAGEIPHETLPMMAGPANYRAVLPVWRP
jgi:helix-turn-helix protein